MIRIYSSELIHGRILRAGASAVTRFLGAFLLGLSPLDGLSFAAAALFWVVTAMLASYLPARRAARVDPVVALR